MLLYHATTPKKINAYKKTNKINKPVRGFTNKYAAMDWAKRVGRTIILELDVRDTHKLPDHHNRYGEAWWNDSDVPHWKCIYTAKDPTNTLLQNALNN